MKRWLLLQCLCVKVIGILTGILSGSVLLGAAIFLSGGIWGALHMVLPRWQGFGDVVVGFRPRGNDVWLTIDDGPDPDDTPRILDLLDRYHAKATFFMVGERALHYPELVQAVISRGHEVANHTHEHRLWTFWASGRQRTERELDRTAEALERGGADIRCFRPPVGIKNLFLNRCLSDRGFHCIAWTIRSGDGLKKNRSAIVSRVLARLHPGAILLMHEGPTVAHPVRVACLAEILAGLRKRGYACVIPDRDAFIYRSW